MVTRTLEAALAAAVISVTTESLRRQSLALGLETLRVPFVDPADALAFTIAGAYIGLYLHGGFAWRPRASRRDRALTWCAGATTALARGATGGLLAFLVGELVMSLCVPDLAGRGAGFAAAGATLAAYLARRNVLHGDLLLRAQATGAFAGFASGFAFTLLGSAFPGDVPARLGAIAILSFTLGLTWPRPRGLLDAAMPVRGPLA